MRASRSTWIAVGLILLVLLGLAPLPLPGQAPPVPQAPSLVGRIDRAGDHVRVTWAPIASRTVTLELSTNLQTWSPAVTVSTWPSRSLLIRDHETNTPRRFYRLRASE